MLNHLIYPSKKKEFLSKVWPGKHFISHGPVKRFGDLLDIPELQDPRLLVSRLKLPARVSLFGPDGFRCPGFSHPEEALPFYETGNMALYFTDIQTVNARFQEISASLATELGLREADVHMEAFAAKGTCTASMHFDLDLNFNVQLRGKKKWRIAPNNHVRNPLESYHVGNHHSADLGVNDYAVKPFPKKMPRNAVSFTTEEGSVVFLPRGYWHETFTEVESFAVTFTIKTACWMDVVLGELEKKLIKDERWRDFLLGLRGAPSEKDRLAQNLSALLCDLEKNVKQLDARAIVSLMEHSENECYRHPDHSRVSIKKESLGEQTHWLLESKQANQEIKQVQFEKEYLPLMRWIAKQKQAFTAKDAMQVKGPLTETVIQGSMKILRDQGVLEKLSG